MALPDKLPDSFDAIPALALCHGRALKISALYVWSNLRSLNFFWARLLKGELKFEFGFGKVVGWDLGSRLYIGSGCKYILCGLEMEIQGFRAS